ncbi:hypothetical protein L6164_035628 [Bauhinia variegata]|uniref:Uncharacterized protein n=1 Tax=Bauhinia variegata TaxID=167791 RepID=A0ACB9KEP2_BAUVA|nr:hypothetical protein L6164_035628 [Bauhinia variegata]
MMDFENDKPSFFVIVREQEHKSLNLERMKIPQKFVPYVDKNLSSDASLTGPCGHHWQVSVCKKGHDIYMVRGWEEFLRDNLVKDGGLLVITYEGETQFSVQFFSSSGLERLFFPEKTDSEAAVPGLARKRGRPRKFSAQAEPPIRNEGSIPKAKGSFSKRHSSTEVDISEAHHKMAASFSSKSPYFKKLMQKSYVPVPADFGRKQLPQHNKTIIILQNLEEKSWEVSFLPGKTPVLSKGWANFARDNGLGVGEICIFELVARNQMRVHIFRC